jgi:hypothetical protein
MKMAMQYARRRWIRWAIWPVLASAALGCTADPPQDAAGAEARSAASSLSRWETKKLGWGTGPEQVGMRPGGIELPAEGPSSVAVAPSGEVVVLDRLNERLLAIGPGGAMRTMASVARDVEHVAVGPDGAAASWSPLRATVWVTGSDGAALGELAVPRVLRDVQRVEMGMSHRLFAVTAMQQTLTLGSPRAPLDLAATLRTGREGAAFLPDGRGVAARRTEAGSGEIWVYERRGKTLDDKPPVAWAHPIEGPLAAVRVVGAAGNSICVRLERVSQVEMAIAVEREALCVEAGTGSVLAKRALGRRGLYTMHEDVAVGGDPAVLVLARPEPDGLALERISLSAEAEVAR